MTEYFKAQNKTNELLINNALKSDELRRFSESDYRWADSKTKNFQYLSVKKGEIYQFEFGKNFVPEMSYEHRGMIIGVRKKLLYVLPVFSYDSKKHPDVYHPIDFPKSKSDMYLLKNIEFSFIKHDSVLKLNDIRTVSVNRILYKHNGQITPDSDTYKYIEALVIQKYFPVFHYCFKQNEEELSLLHNKISDLKEKQSSLLLENSRLHSELKTLQEKISVKSSYSSI